MARILDVYLYDLKVGQLAQDEAGRLFFAYDKDTPETYRLSFSMPVDGTVYGDRVCHAFFGGLLPEESERDKLAEYFKVSKKNDFRLLEIIGGDCAGAVSLYPEGDKADISGMNHDWDECPAHELSNDELLKIFQSLNAMPLLTSQNIRMSLAGAQKKLALIKHEDKFYLPEKHQVTTHILKPQHLRHEYTVENEFFCMSLAQKIFLRTPQVEVVDLGGGYKVLVVMRYDRFVEIYNGKDMKGFLKRQHQEDFCQALSFSPDTKYQDEQGPGYLECFDLLKKATETPASNIKIFLEMICFHYLIGNNDAHGKNFSLIYSKYEGLVKSTASLAPLYDVLCTEVYEGLKNKMAMKIGNSKSSYDPYGVYKRHWEKFAEQTGLSASYVLKTLNETAKKMDNDIKELMINLEDQEIFSPIFNDIVSVFQKRADHISKY